MFSPPILPTRPLTRDELRQRVETHLLQQRVFAVVLLVGSSFAWGISFVAVYLPSSLVLWILGQPRPLATIPALLAVMALAGYGVWKAVGILRLDDDRFIHYLMDTTLSEMPWNTISLDYAIAWTLLVELVLSAPKSAIMALRIFRTLKIVDDDVIEQAHAVRRRLFENRDTHRWMKLDDFAGDSRGIVLLHELKLVSIDESDHLVRLAS